MNAGSAIREQFRRENISSRILDYARATGRRMGGGLGDDWHTQAEVEYSKTLCRCAMQWGYISLPRAGRGGAEEAASLGLIRPSRACSSAFTTSSSSSSTSRLHITASASALSPLRPPLIYTSSPLPRLYRHCHRLLVLLHLTVGAMESPAAWLLGPPLRHAVPQTCLVVFPRYYQLLLIVVLRSWLRAPASASAPSFSPGSPPLPQNSLEVVGLFRPFYHL